MIGQYRKVLEAIRLIDKIAYDSGGKTEYKMNRIWHMTQQVLNGGEAITEPVIGCESCEGTGRIECLPDCPHSSPCDDCNPVALKEFNRGYNAANYIALHEPVINDKALAEAVSNAQGMINCRNAMKSQIFPDINDGLNKDISTIETLINHVVKGEKVAEVEYEDLLQMWRENSLNAIDMIKKNFPNGIKIIDGAAS